MKPVRRTRYPIVRSAVLLSLVISGAFCGEAPRDPKQNAALQYWLAFALLPNTAGPDAKVFTEKVGERLTEATRAHLSQASLPMLRRGAAMPYCEWGLNEEDGPGMLMPHLAKARHLGRTVAFGFQQHAEDGKPNEGVDDLAAAFSFSRHIASDGIVISFLVRCAIDALLIDRTAFFLPQLDQDHLKELAKALDRLPSAPTAADAVRSEKRVFGDWIRARLAAGTGKEDPGELLLTIRQIAPELAAITKEQVQVQVEELSRFYDELVALHALPMDEFQKKLPEQEARVEKAGALTRMCLPALSRIRPKEVEMEVRFRMFRTAIDVLLEGPGALARYPDPYDGKPFTHRATPDGFELTSNLKVNEKVVTLTVGGKLGAAPKPEAAQPQGDPPPKAPEF